MKALPAASKTLLVILLGTALALGVCACGGSSHSSTAAGARGTSSSATNASTEANGGTQSSPSSEPDKDANDDDYLTPQDRNDDGEVVEFGRPANAAELRSISAFVKRYLSAAATENGAQACSLIESKLAVTTGVAHGRAPGPPGRPGSPCARYMTKLFHQRHSQLVAENAAIEIPAARIRGNQAYALLALKTSTERRFMALAKVSGKWVMSDELIDGPYP